MGLCSAFDEKVYVKDDTLSNEIRRIEEIVETTPKEDIVELNVSELRSNPYQPRKTFNEEALNELDTKIHELIANKIATVIYYSNGECIKISGMVAKIEHTSRILQIVNKRISFDDILDIIIDE